MLEHGGHVRAAAQRFRIPLSAWLDLSTGINPNGWPVPSLPPECWQRLPEADDDLLEVAQAYYRNDSILPVAGSQAAIQTLPLLRGHSRVGVLRPAYAEHAANWRETGHRVIELEPADIEHALTDLDVLIIVNPNNPTGQEFEPEQLLHWHRLLQKRQGWLIIDEAFIDSRLEKSLTAHPVEEGLIVLRSLGKFFGLAGIRCGFVIGLPALLQRLNDNLGPWAISHPSRYIATQALKDSQWQQQTRAALLGQARRLRQLLSAYGLQPAGGTDLFQWIPSEQAAEIHRFLAERGILTRLFQHPSSLRFGLPGEERHWRLLQQALAALANKQPKRLTNHEYS
ncbi:threonine-phosphate decarboxylase CobD [Methylomarinum vadi]|uniref:threonine-phosphate decarboxylase CobD n=1 Tax=Methylomarinum vadi TaxID=438855 RepID=UPI00055B4C51|nr:threonine-phosphate decarboxylase CobD [Methylomarinum vadi]